LSRFEAGGTEKSSGKKPANAGGDLLFSASTLNGVLNTNSRNFDAKVATRGFQEDSIVTKKASINQKVGEKEMREEVSREKI
jgi:hypothetical protein